MFLDLSSNFIRSIDGDIFSNTRLSILYLNKNRINAVGSSLFDSFPADDIFLSVFLEVNRYVNSRFYIYFVEILEEAKLSLKTCFENFDERSNERIEQNLGNSRNFLERTVLTRENTLNLNCLLRFTCVKA